MKIPEKYYKAGKHPTASDVGQLKALLNELPNDLQLCGTWGGAPELIVYNYGQPDMHLELHDTN